MVQTPITPVEEAPHGYAQGGDGKGALNRRIAGVVATILAEVLIVALLLTLGWNLAQGEPEAPVLTTLEARNTPAASPSERQETPPDESQPEAEPEPQPPEPEPLDAPEPPLPRPLDPPPLVLPNPLPTPRPPPSPPQPTPQAPSKPPRVYGPPDTGAPSYSNDSQLVGTAPNGEPMYAARWYREPTRQELAGYLSTATGPGSALIVCKTVPGFYVEDCELLGEAPRGSQMGRAVLAAAWQFRVRPAVVGGQSQFGSWVRIRIDYTIAGQR
ncbi:MAG: hypothetical protein AAF650_01965 [Pseudomonadota bacterium]